MSKKSVKIKCPGCEHTQDIIFKKPSPLTPTIHKCLCGLRESSLIIAIGMNRDNRNNVDIAVKIGTPSKTLIEAMEENKQRKLLEDTTPHLSAQP
jgi:hypothetical protein